MDTPVCAAISRTVTRRPSGRLTICYTAVFHDRSIGSGRPIGGYHRPFGPLLLTSWGPYWFATRHNKFKICFILLHDGTTMARIRFVMAALGALAVTSATTLAAAASASAAPVTAHVWVTTPDGTDNLTPTTPVSSASPAYEARRAAPARLVETERAPGRRPPQRLPAPLPVLRALPAEVHPVAPGNRLGCERDYGTRRAAEPPPLRLSRHRHALGPGGE